MPTSKGRSPIPINDRFWPKVRKTKSCWWWTASKNNKGYGHIIYKGKVEQAHRVSWIICNGAIPKGKRILHTCDNPSCVRPDHLFIGTEKTNAIDRENKGRGRSGLSPDDIKTIRNLYQEGMTQQAIAKRFKKGVMSISRIVRGEQGQPTDGPTVKPFEGMSGERHYSAKLTKRTVTEIRKLYQKGGITMRALAHQFGVSSSRISDTINNKAWL